VWGQVDYQKRNADGDGEAGAYNSKRASAFMGMDAKVSDAAILGASVGVVGNHVNEHRFGDDIDGDGMQLGLYGVYDPGAFYVKALTTYSWFDGDSRRDINFAGLGTGTSFAATVNGDPDVKMWTVGLHGGARMPMGGASVITPYLNLDYVHASMGEFIEDGTAGPALIHRNPAYRTQMPSLFSGRSSGTPSTICGSAGACAMAGVTAAAVSDGDTA
jgi:outer membrane autotransporter protein